MSGHSFLERQEVSSTVRVEPSGALAVKEGEETTWTCHSTASVNFPPSSYWSVGGERYQGNSSISSNTQHNGVKVEQIRD